MRPGLVTWLPGPASGGLVEGTEGDVATIRESGRFEVFAGLDVGKQDHHLHVIDAAGEVLASQRVGNDASGLRPALQRAAEHGRAVLVVDQLAALGAAGGGGPGPGGAGPGRPAWPG